MEIIMSFNIGKVFQTVAPAAMNMFAQSALNSNPYGMALGTFLQNGPMSGGNNFFSMFKNIASLLGKMRQFKTPDSGSKDLNVSTPNFSPEKKINDILQSNLSIEEKIILIAGVVSESVTEQLEDKLSEQGKLAKKLNDKTEGSGGDAAKIQNVENKIQLLMQRLNRMQSMASNMVQALHTTKKSMISNIRV
jgi:hypothetical protein